VEERDDKITGEMDDKDVGVLLQSTQQLRTHWSGCIVTLIGYTVTFIVAIWAFSLKSYIDSGSNRSQPDASYLLLAASLSAFLVGAWRYYAHEIDSAIAGLYGDFILYEGLLGIGHDHGTNKYLTRAVPNVELILSNKELDPEQRSKLIGQLADMRRMGKR